MEADFSGYATKAGIKCSDGRTISPDAFKHQDTMTVPLVWSHVHGDPEQVLGHALLEARDASHPDGAGIYCYGFFNDTPKGLASKKLVRHKDVTSLSIFANQLVEKVVNGAKQVLHGAIREVSLVLAGANEGAKIDFIGLSHGDDVDPEFFDDQAIIFTGLELSHSDGTAIETPADEELEHADPTIQDVYDSMSQEQKDVVHFMIGAALETADVKHSDDDVSEETSDDAESEETSDDAESEETSEDDVSDENSSDDAESDDTTEGDLNHQEGSTMTRVFEQNAGKADGTTLTHDQLVTIVDNAKKTGSFKEAVLAHAGEYGIDNIELLFPDAQALTQTPEWISRRMEWVSTVLDGTKHSPFAKVKTLLADITAPEARAKGYIKGNRKEEEVFGLLKRSTSPSTIYKKQKLDRDDLLDITDINVVAWLKAEMRLMIEEEIARAILVGDGRSAMNPDKVKDPAGANDGVGIRSVYKDDDLYSIKVELPANVAPKDTVKAVVRAMVDYKGTGNPTLFISRRDLVDLMLEEDKFGRPLYADRAALADKFGVGKIETVDLFDEYDNLFAIVVSLSDYTIGTNKGGELTPFEDFDIDFNQYKYLQETRLSGGLTKPFSAVVISKAQGEQATPTAPSYNGTTSVITVPSVTGVEYLINDNVVSGAQDPITEPTEVVAEPAEGFYFASGTTKTWSYTP